MAGLACILRRLTIVAVFGNVTARTRPSLRSCSLVVGAVPKVRVWKGGPGEFALYTSSRCTGSREHHIANALGVGIVELNVGTDTRCLSGATEVYDQPYDDDETTAVRRCPHGGLGVVQGLVQPSGPPPPRPDHRVSLEVRGYGASRVRSERGIRASREGAARGCGKEMFVIKNWDLESQVSSGNVNWRRSHMARGSASSARSSVQLPQHTVFLWSAEILLRISEALLCAYCRCLRHCEWLRWCQGIRGYYDVRAVDLQGGSGRPPWKSPPGAAACMVLKSCTKAFVLERLDMHANVIKGRACVISAGLSLTKPEPTV